MAENLPLELSFVASTCDTGPWGAEVGEMQVWGVHPKLHRPYLKKKKSLPLEFSSLQQRIDLDNPATVAG